MLKPPRLRLPAAGPSTPRRRIWLPTAGPGLWLPPGSSDHLLDVKRSPLTSNPLSQPAPQGYQQPPPPASNNYGRPSEHDTSRAGGTHALTTADMPTVSSNSYVHGNHNAPPPPPQTTQHYGYGSHGFAFQYSQCTGRRKALLIGINYFNQRGQLRGCINDVRNMSAYLVENFGYKREDMVILTDDQQNPMSQPTKQNILRAMHWLVKDARPNDSLFFHYSGRCTRTVLALVRGGSLTLRRTRRADKRP